MNPSQTSFFKLVDNPARFGLYLFTRLPAAFFSGVRVRSINENLCMTSVPYKWLTQNPFRSTYFASLAMAAEMSTGLLALSNIYKRDFRVSMLVIKMEASYFKKATGATLFTCAQGQEFTSVIAQAVQSGKPAMLTARSIGKNKTEEEVAEFHFTWSFKVKAGNL